MSRLSEVESVPQIVDWVTNHHIGMSIYPIIYMMLGKKPRLV